MTLSTTDWRSAVEKAMQMHGYLIITCMYPIKIGTVINKLEYFQEIIPQPWYVAEQSTREEYRKHLQQSLGMTVEESMRYGRETQGMRYFYKVTTD